MNGVTLYGLIRLAGRTVSVWLAGLDCGDYVVAANGSILVPYQSDPDGLLTAVYLIALNSDEDWGPLAMTVDVITGFTIASIVVPCVVGFTYTSQGQVVRPQLESEIKSSQGVGLGKIRRLHQYGVLVDSSVALEVSYGTDFDNLLPADYRDKAGNLLNHATLYNGVFWNTLSDDYSYDGMFCWQITRPFPHNMISLTGIMETSEG